MYQVIAVVFVSVLATIPFSCSKSKDNGTEDQPKQQFTDDAESESSQKDFSASKSAYDRSQCEFRDFMFEKELPDESSENRTGFYSIDSGKKLKGDGESLSTYRFYDNCTKATTSRIKGTSYSIENYEFTKDSVSESYKLKGDFVSKSTFYGDIERSKIGRFQVGDGVYTASEFDLKTGKLLKSVTITSDSHQKAFDCLSLTEQEEFGVAGSYLDSLFVLRFSKAGDDACRVALNMESG
ncbi:hypothetical protein N9D31_03150, partial [Oligoflexaceae bacterium]|nr:hypothetical protein [Oligoflexaceae bacterium]